MKNVIVDILLMIYQYAGASIIFATMAMFIIALAKKYGIKGLIEWWLRKFKKDKKFRTQVVFLFYLFIVMCRTIIGRHVWTNPLDNVLGDWRIYLEDGSINKEMFENIFMLLPYIFLMFAAFPKILDYKKIENSTGILNISVKAVVIAFFTSIVIEFCQLLFNLGTFQLSDIVFNTIGGVIGGLIYWIIIKIKR